MKITSNVEFFQTKTKAKKFLKNLGCGHLFSNAPEDETRGLYKGECNRAYAAGINIDTAAYPYCVAWTEVQ